MILVNNPSFITALSCAAKGTFKISAHQIAAKLQRVLKGTLASVKPNKQKCRTFAKEQGSYTTCCCAVNFISSPQCAVKGHKKNSGSFYPLESKLKSSIFVTPNRNNSVALRKWILLSTVLTPSGHKQSWLSVLVDLKGLDTVHFCCDRE